MKAHLSKILLVSMSLFVSLDAQCQLHFTELKGLEANLQLKSEYDYLHPLHGFALSKQGILSNLYNYPNVDDKNKITESYSRKDYVDLKKKISDLKTEDQRARPFDKTPRRAGVFELRKKLF